jgi:hypothetical protein
MSIAAAAGDAGAEEDAVPTGAIIAAVFFAVFALWGIIAFSRRVIERGSEKSSHHESGIGIQAAGQSHHVSGD